MDLGIILTLTIDDLRKKLEEVGLATDGQKADLQGRLLKHFGIDESGVKFSSKNKPKVEYNEIEVADSKIAQLFIESNSVCQTRVSEGKEVDLQEIVLEDNVTKKEVEEISIEELHQERSKIRNISRQNIQRIQKENIEQLNKRRVPEKMYEVGDLVAIKRTQYGTGLKLKPKYLGPYKVTEVMSHGRYAVEKVGQGEGSKKCTTVAEYMKSWGCTFETNVQSGGPNVGSHKFDRRVLRVNQQK